MVLLNKTWTLTTPVNMALWLGVINTGLHHSLRWRATGNKKLLRRSWVWHLRLLGYPCVNTMGDRNPDMVIFCSQTSLPVGTGTPRQPHNLQTTFCTTSKMCWCKGNTELVGVAKEWLAGWDLCQEREPKPNTAWRARTQRLGRPEAEEGIKHH